MHSAVISADTFRHPLPRTAVKVPTSLVFFGILTFVGLISLYDGYLVIRTGDMIREFEKNPVGTYLLDCGHGNPTLFLTAKAIGTALVLGIATMLYRHCHKFAFPVAYALLLFQTGLLIFLERA